MKFSSPEETLRAAVLTVRWLPALVRAFEDGVTGIGLEITDRSHFLDDEGRACMTLVARGKRLTLRLGLRNALEDFLAVDREARPVQVDDRLADDDYAGRKLAEIVDGRIAIVRTLDESPDIEAARARIDELAERFEWLRTTFVEARPPEKPPCQLTGHDGNVFAVIGRVRRALINAGQAERAAEFVERAHASSSYDEVLALCWEYVEVF